MSFTPPNIPQLLRDKAQWLVWRLVQRPDEPKPRKVPFYANGNMRGWPNGRPSDGRPTEDQPQVEQGHPLDTASLVSFDEAVQVVRYQPPRPASLTPWEYLPSASFADAPARTPLPPRGPPTGLV